MAQYRERPGFYDWAADGFKEGPLPVEAFRLGDEWPDWWADAVSAGTAKTFNMDGRMYGGPDCAEITTAHGVVCIERGDWVIQGVEDDIFACKSDFFAKAYERVP